MHQWVRVSNWRVCGKNLTLVFMSSNWCKRKAKLRQLFSRIITTSKLRWKSRGEKGGLPTLSSNSCTLPFFSFLFPKWHSVLRWWLTTQGIKTHYKPKVVLHLWAPRLNSKLEIRIFISLLIVFLVGQNISGLGILPSAQMYSPQRGMPCPPSRSSPGPNAIHQISPVISWSQHLSVVGKFFACWLVGFVTKYFMFYERLSLWRQDSRCFIHLEQYLPVNMSSVNICSVSS